METKNQNVKELLTEEMQFSEAKKKRNESFSSLGAIILAGYYFYTLMGNSSIFYIILVLIFNSILIGLVVGMTIQRRKWDKLSLEEKLLKKGKEILKSETKFQNFRGRTGISKEELQEFIEELEATKT